MAEPIPPICMLMASPEVPPAPPPPQMPGGDEHGAAQIVLGIIFAVMAAACVGGAMPVQRYGLTYHKAHVPVFCCSLRKSAVWFLGLILYGIGNGCQAFSLTLGPLFLLGGVFTLLLVFNLVFARLLLRERLSLQKVSGALLILGGVGASIMATPDNTQVRFSAADLELLAKRPQGLAYLVFLFGSLIATATAIIVFETRYPPQPARDEKAHEDAAEQEPEFEVSLDDNAPLPASKKGKDGVVVPSTEEEARVPPQWLHRVMSVIYPLSLGLDEGVCQLTLRAWLVILTDCNDPESETSAASCKHWMLPTFATIWVICSLLCVPYMLVVFRRYETTVALPVEYGTVNVINVASGLLFYNEGRTFSDTSMTVILSAVCVVVVGIALSQSGSCGRPRIRCWPCTRTNKSNGAPPRLAVPGPARTAATSVHVKV